MALPLSTKTKRIFSISRITRRILWLMLGDIFLLQPMVKVLVMGLENQLKRKAARANLLRPYKNHILTPFQLYEWLKMNLSQKMEFFEVTQKDYVKPEQHLEHRGNQAIRQCMDPKGSMHLSTWNIEPKFKPRLCHCPRHLKLI